MNDRHLLNPDEVGKYSRPISKHMDADLLTSFIAEAEDLDIRPALGDVMWSDLVLHPDLAYNSMLIEGGIIPQTFGETFDKSFALDSDAKMTVGIKKALAYYTYARIVKWNDVQVTRFGSVKKDEENSSHTSNSERTNQSGVAFDLADRYLADVLSYIKAYPERYPLYGKNCEGNITNSRNTYKVIGY